MLFIKDQSGDYLPAPKEIVFTEAKRLSSYQLRRGVRINVLLQTESENPLA